MSSADGNALKVAANSQRYRAHVPMYRGGWQVHQTALTTSAMPPNIGAGPGLAMPCGYRNWRHVPVPASPCTRSLINPAPHLVALGHDGTLHGMY